MQNLPITAGDCVRVRRERWRVVSVRPYDECRLLTLNGIGSRNQGLEKRVLLPFDAAEPVRTGGRVAFVGSRRWQQACRRLIAGHGGADALRTARTARIDLLAHQLEPALAIVRGLAARILIADDVGLGKTIQAGLIVSELTLRGAAERVLVLTPAGLRDQWIGELHDRFGLRFSLADTRAIQHRRATLRPDINPWSTYPLVVASIDYAKRPEVLPALESCRWDLVIIDEAHGVVTAGDRNDAVSRLAARAPYLLLLTATPHNGDAAAFASLRAIGGHGDPLLVFRRTRGDVGMATDRRVRRLVVQPSEPERAMHARLEEFTRAVVADHSDRSPDLSLALSTIQKRALSSAFALYQTVHRRLLALAGGGGPPELQLLLPLDEEPGEHDHEDAIPGWTCPALHDPEAERRLLTAVADAALAAFGAEAKLQALRRLIRRIDEPVLVFTEYRDTLLHVRDGAFAGAAVIHGGLSRAERRAAVDAFTRGDRRVLMATDAAGEGLNLHRSCRVVINLELPWNPMRLEQRIGRVDRIGQRRSVHAIHLIAAGTREVALIERLQGRLARARHDIGVPDPLGAFAGSTAAAVETTRIDATVEYRRLIDARQLTHGLQEDRLDSGVTSMRHVAAGIGTLVSTARRRVRVRIGPRALALRRTVLADGSGNAVAQDVSGLLVPAEQGRGRRSKARVRAVLDTVAAASACQPTLGRASWAEPAAAIHAAFWRRRLERERSIRQALLARLDQPHQPGLFWLQEPETAPPRSIASNSAIGEGVYITAAERFRAVTVSPAVVVLLLLP